MYFCMMWHSSHTTKDLYDLTNISKVPKLNCIMSVVGEIVTSLEVALASYWSCFITHLARLIKPLPSPPFFVLSANHTPQYHSCVLPCNL